MNPFNLSAPQRSGYSSLSHENLGSRVAHHLGRHVYAYVFLVLVVIAVPLTVLGGLGVFNKSSSSSSVLVGQGDNLQISVLPDVNPPSSRRSDRRSYSTAGSDYDLYKTSERVNVPGSDTLDTVNMILCFIASTGMFAVDPSTGAYQALVDMSRCQSGQRNSQKEIYLVTAYNLASSSTASSSTFSGNVGFHMRSNTTSELRAQISLTIHSVASAETCPGVAIKASEGAETKTCWTGSMKWREGTRMSGYFLGTYDASDADFPVTLEFKEQEQGNSSLIMRTDTTGENVNAKLMQSYNGDVIYYCINANATHARVSKSASAETACAATSSGGMCLSRQVKTIYPFSFRLFADATGANVAATGITNLDLEYTGPNDQRCHAGVSASGSYANCGAGDAGGISLFDDGTEALDNDGTAYTLHNSNARIEKLTIKSVTLEEFSAGSYLSYFQWVSASSKFYQYILGRNGTSNSVLTVHYKRYAVGGEWSDFVAGATGESVNVGTGDIQAQACKMSAVWYTGTEKPTSPNWFSFVSDYRERTYSPADGRVYFPVSNGLLSTNEDLDLVCPVVCTRLDTFSGSCYEYARCPKTVHSGLTLGSSCTGSGCTSFPRTTDTAYRYRFKASDRLLYALQNNSGTSIAAVAIDSQTGVTYDAQQQWQQTTTSRMYAGTNASSLNSPAKIAAYMKVSGSVYYDVGIGMRGSYSGWTFYAKRAGAFVDLSAPLSCAVTMGADANGDTGHAGSVLFLTFYQGFTEGLRFDTLDFGNVEMGSRQLQVPAPQLADGTACVDGDTTYRIKSEFRLIVPKETTAPCSAWDTMTSAGTLPTDILAPNNRDTDTPVVTKICVTERALTNAAGCVYYAGAANAG